MTYHAGADSLAGLEAVPALNEAPAEWAQWRLLCDFTQPAQASQLVMACTQEHCLPAQTLCVEDTHGHHKI